MVITCESKTPWDEYSNHWIMSGKEKIALFSKSSFRNTFHFHPEKKYKEILKDVRTDYLYDIMSSSAQALGAIYAYDTNGDGDFIIGWAPNHEGWVVAQKNLELIKFNNHVIGERRYVNKGNYHMHATKFLKRETARKIAKLCGGKALRLSDIIGTLENNLSFAATIAANLRLMDFNCLTVQQLGLLKHNFECLTRLGWTTSKFQEHFFTLWDRYQEHLEGLTVAI